MTVPVATSNAPVAGPLHSSMTKASIVRPQRLSLGSPRGLASASAPVLPGAMSPGLSASWSTQEICTPPRQKIIDPPRYPRYKAEELQDLVAKAQEKTAARELTLSSLQKEILELRQECQLGREEFEKLGQAVEQSIPACDHFEILRSMSHEHLNAAYHWERKERDADAEGRASYEQLKQRLEGDLAKREARLRDFAIVGTQLQRASAAHKANEARSAKLEDQLRQLANVHQLVGDCQAQVETAQRQALDCWRHLQQKLAEAQDLRAKCAAFKAYHCALTGEAVDSSGSQEFGPQAALAEANSARSLVLAHLDALEGQLVRKAKPTTKVDAPMKQEETTPTRLGLPASMAVSVGPHSPATTASPQSAIIARSGTLSGTASEAFGFPSTIGLKADAEALSGYTGAMSTTGTTAISALGTNRSMSALGTTGGVSAASFATLSGENLSALSLSASSLAGNGKSLLCSTAATPATLARPSAPSSPGQLVSASRATPPSPGNPVVPVAAFSPRLGQR